jgi:hypothetical protein
MSEVLSPRNSKYAKVGAWISKLSSEEKEKLKTLESKDFNHRI